MANEYYNIRNTGPDEKTVTIIDFKPDKPEPEVEPLRLGLVARDACGDGTDEFKHIEPLVTWQTFPVKVFLESSIPNGLRSAVIRSFEAFNTEAGFKFYEFTNTTTSAKVRVSIAPIDVAGGTIARAQWSYKTSTKEITKATITFDSSEAWGDLSAESCGRTGNIFDCANVGTHEFGHISGLSHAPTDKLQTMYASTSPGKTLCRTLGNGDKKGFKLAYKIQPKPTPPAPTPTPKPTPIPPAPKPEPKPPHKHELTKKQKKAIAAAELQYKNALKSGNAAGIKTAKENLDLVRRKTLIELH